jgi:hypothetical protein
MEFDKNWGSFDDFLNEEATLIENNVVMLTPPAYFVNEEQDWCGST